jgi:hypothetical protein
VSLGDLCNDAAMTDNTGDDMNARIRRGRSLPLLRTQREPEPEPEPEPVDLGAGPRAMASVSDPHAAFNAWIRQQYCGEPGILLSGKDLAQPSTRGSMSGLLLLILIVLLIAAFGGGLFVNNLLWLLLVVALIVLVVGLVSGRSTV